MGYLCVFKTDRPVFEDEFHEIMKEMPPAFQGHFGVNKQFWGWSMACDVKLNKEEISVSGSCSISGDVVKPFIRDLRRRLRKREYTLTRTRYHW